MANKSILTPDAVRQLLDYDPKTGALTWRERTPDAFQSGRRTAEHTCANWNSQFGGKPAFGVVTKNGYMQGTVFGAKYLAHRIIWLLEYGVWPDGDIDHINGVRTDNRLSNLRDVPRSVNSKNAKRSIANTSGVTGVRWYARKSKWRAEICVDGKSRSLGYYSTIEEAAAARALASHKHGFTERHGSI